MKIRTARAVRSAVGAAAPGARRALCLLAALLLLSLPACGAGAMQAPAVPSAASAPEPTPGATPALTPEPSPEPTPEPTPLPEPPEGFQATEDGLFWRLERGVLTISGQGDMTDYGQSRRQPPWIQRGNAVQQLVVEEGVRSIGANAFYGCEQLSRISLPASLVSVGDYAFARCIPLYELRLPEGLTRIGASAFSGCMNLRVLSLPESLRSIGDYAFADCVSLPEAVLPQGLTELGGYAFFGCTGLGAAQLPESLSQLGAYAFRGCVCLRELQLPEGLPAVPEGLCYDCFALQAVRVPGSAQSIEPYAFYRCAILTRLEFSGTRAQWEALSVGQGNDFSSSAFRLICADDEP